MNKNGCFIAIFPNKDAILNRLKSNGWRDGQKPPTLQNNVYKL